MKSYIRFLILGSTLLTMACRDKFDIPGYKQDYGVPVSIQYSIAPRVMVLDHGSEIEAVTRAAGIETDINNVWVFQFDGTANDSKLIGDPLYFDLTGDSGNTFSGVIKLVSTEKVYRLVVIANNNDPAYSWGMMGGQSDFATLKTKGMEVTYTGISNRINMPMACILDTKVSSEEIANGLNLEFKQNLAKVELELTVPTTVENGLTIQSVQLLNIPSDVHWCEGAVTFDDPSEVHPGNDVKRIDYALVKDPNLLPKTGETKTFTWYVPRNRQGVSSNTIESQKNLSANTMATYIEVMAIDGEGNDIRYVLYPGLNKINNFNIESHYHYHIPLTINGIGDPDIDSRVDNLSKVIFGKANSYILNPSTGSGTKIFYIPIERVNDFWADPIYTLYGTDPSKAFTESTKWVCELAWHNNTNLYATGTKSDTHLTLYKTSGVGISNAYLQVRLPATQEEGSLVVGLYKADDSGNKTGNCMWSWHLWVTNYNPDVPVVIDESHHTFAVPNGQVERYGGRAWGYSTNTNYDGWNPTPSYDSPNTQTVMMDRYLGLRATDMNFKYERYKNPSLLYQYGRMQPMPAPAYPIYDKDNIQLSPAISQSNLSYFNMERRDKNGVTMVEAIGNPTRFYESYDSYEKRAWMTTTREFPFSGSTEANVLIWYDLRKSHYSSEQHKKSLFDPCPLGWKLPSLARVGNDYVAFCGDFRKETISNREGLQRFIDGVWAVRYWPYKAVASGGYPVEGKITYPLYPAFYYDSDNKKMRMRDDISLSKKPSSIWMNNDLKIMLLNSSDIHEINYTTGDFPFMSNLVRCIKE